MSEMIERVAHAIRVEFTGMFKEDQAPAYERLARAAIEALREPTEEMLIASEVDLNDFDVAAVWSVMIDAALKQGTEPVAHGNQL